MPYVLERGRHDNYKEIGRYKTEQDAFEAIRALLALERYEVFYSRLWKNEDGWTTMDYGSHANFFRFKEVSDDAI
jgi:hypothetical protein